VAPEEDLILYEITKILEDNDVKTIGSSSEAVLACSDKFETYNLLKDHYPVIKSEKVLFSDLKECKHIFSGGKDFLVKPADGVSCSGVQIVQSYADFIKASHKGLCPSKKNNHPTLLPFTGPGGRKKHQC